MNLSTVIPSTPTRQVARPAFQKFCLDGLFIAGLFLLYVYTPYYATFLRPLAKTVIAAIFLLWFLGAFPYYLWLYRKRPAWFREEDSKSFLVIRWFWRILTSPSLRAAKLSEMERVALTGIFVKAFFFPVMLNFFTLHATQIFKLIAQNPWSPAFRGDASLWFYAIALTLLFLLDTFIFAFAYAVEFPGLRNHIKSVDPTFLGWFVCLISYPPFNQYSGAFIWNLAPAYSSKILIGPAALWATRLIALLLFAIYLWATLALFWKSGNLVNRGIISHGPYRFIRHPSYAAKNIAWWFEKLPYMTTPLQAIPLIVWNMVYVLRALTEERHLLRDPDYQKYVKKVRHRFIPGLV